MSVWGLYPEGLCPGGSLSEGLCLGWSLSGGGGALSIERPPVNRMADATKNVTLWVVIMLKILKYVKRS